MLTIEQINELKLVKYPTAVLCEQAHAIEVLDPWVEQLARRMIELMREHKGVGLAGNQVGHPLAIFTANPSGAEGEEIVVINPRIVDAAGWDDREEGCLSLPTIYGQVRRRAKVIVEGIDLSGKRVELEANGLLARVLQHEVDHLSGTLIFQRMSPLARLAVRRQLKELEGQA